MPILPTHKLVKFLALFCYSGALLLFFLFPLPSHAAFTKQINYQGKLTNSAGSAVSDTSYTIVFTLYDALTGGNVVWTETNTVTTQRGLFSLMLGSVTSLDDVNFNQPLYLTLNVNGDGEMTPRKTLGAVASSFTSARLDGNASSTAIDVSGYLSVSGVTTLATTTFNFGGWASASLKSYDFDNDSYFSTLSGQDRAVFFDSIGARNSFVIWNDQNQWSTALTFGGDGYPEVAELQYFPVSKELTFSGVNNNSSLFDLENFFVNSKKLTLFSSSSDPAIRFEHLGPSDASISVSSTTEQLTFSLASSYYFDNDFLVGNSNNTLSKISGTNIVLGGYGNTIENVMVSGIIIGGHDNHMNGNGVLIGIGSGNYTGQNGQIFGAWTSTSTAGAVFGGLSNETLVGSNPVIVGGTGNIASSTNGGVFVGESNLASGWRAVVVGGLNNQALGLSAGTYSGQGNIVWGESSSVLGGINNYIGSDALGAVILGGSHSTSTGHYSAIIGGERNEVSGDHSLTLDGADNTITGDYSNILGGANNTVSGNNSYAMGSGMTVSGLNSFGIGLGLTTGTVSANNVFALIGGSLGIGTVAPQTALDVLGTASSTNLQVNGNATTTGFSALATTSMAYDSWIGSNLITNSFKFTDYTVSNSGMLNGLGVNMIRSANDFNGVFMENTMAAFAIGDNDPTIAWTSDSAADTVLASFATTTQVLSFSGAANGYEFDIFPSVGADPMCWDGAGASLIGDCSSLGKYKTNQEAFTSGLQDILQLQPKHFDWKRNADGTLSDTDAYFSLDPDTGFIAEEVSGVNKNFGRYDSKTGELRDVNERGLLGALVNAIKEIWSTLTILIARVDNLEKNNGTNNSAQGVMTQDKVTGQYYCIYIENGIIKTSLGECPGVSVLPSGDDGGLIATTTVTNSQVEGENTRLSLPIEETQVSVEPKALPNEAVVSEISPVIIEPQFIEPDPEIVPTSPLTSD